MNCYVIVCLELGVGGTFNKQTFKQIEKIFLEKEKAEQYVINKYPLKPWENKIKYYIEEHCIENNI